MATPTACSTPRPCPTEGCHISRGDGLGILLGFLGIFALVAGLAILLTRRALRLKGAAVKSPEGTDFWYTARNSQRWPSIAFSVCATSAGGWLLYTPAEAAVMGGWVPAASYGDREVSAADARWCQHHGLGVTALRARGLRLRHTRLGLLHVHLHGRAVEDHGRHDEEVHWHGTRGRYDTPRGGHSDLHHAGGPSSVHRHRLAPGYCILILAFAVCISTWSWVEVTEDTWKQVSEWSDRGWEMSISVCFAIFSAEFFNLAFWQRVYAAQDVLQLRIGFVVGAAMVGYLTFLFGVTGLLLKANDLGKPCGSSIDDPAATFLDVLELKQMDKGTRMVLYMLVVCMIASNADSFHAAVTSTISRVLQQREWPVWRNLAVAELFILIVNVPCAAFALYAVHDTEGLAANMRDLLSTAAVLTITLVAPVCAGLWSFVTTLGTLAGIASGVLFTMAWGWLEFDTFMGGMEMITLMCFGNIQPPPSENGAPGCGFYSARAAIIFPVIPILTGVVALLVSYMERTWKHMEASERERHGRPKSAEKYDI